MRAPRNFRLLAGLGLLLGAGPVVAQLPTELPQGRFLQPTARVGDVVGYELTYRHRPDLEIIFPDSSAEFRPFEFVRKTARPTRTRKGVSLDQTVYYLRTFALDSVQQLRLPVTLLQGTDTLTVAPAEPARLQLLATAPLTLPDGPPALQQSTAPLPVEQQFNYPYWLAAAGLLVLLVAGLALGFGRRLRQRYQLYKLRKNHVYFLAQYARHIERFTLSRSLSNMERAITLWKNYLTGLEDNAINSLTTKEIVAHYQNDLDVSLALRVADRVIYGNQFTDDEVETDDAFARLRTFAERRYALVTASFQQ
ncbi:hypothetical protein LJY25_09625 [Hymenobacter sp. BT175]|uniref:hypothetical protein n=1 Tax=Hymenobacter translucens TaxID=2886507 RepID=UPI001D0EB452|nr:hypothetical protein [Hymenobacter translucens]MCC2546700.1 hypothetical protein [Hymenobacter translucens]